MRFHVRAIRFLLSGLCALCWAQSVVPPTVSDPPGKLALEASRKLDAWIGYRPGLVRDLFRLPPEAAASALREAEGRMREYSDAQIALYDGLGTWVNRDISAMEKLTSTEWTRFLNSRETGYKQELEALRGQELRFEKELEDLKGTQGKEAQSAWVILKDQLTQLRSLKDKVSNQLIAIDSAGREDPALGHQTMMKNLRAHQEELKKLRDMEVTTRGYMESYYRYLQAAVGTQPSRQGVQVAGQQADPTRQVLPATRQTPPSGAQTGESSQGTQQPSVAAPATALPSEVSESQRDSMPRFTGGSNSDPDGLRPSGVPPQPTVTPQANTAVGTPSNPDRSRVIRGWGRYSNVGDRYSESWPPRIIFEVRIASGATIGANFRAWFEPGDSDPNVVFDCTGTISEEQIICTGSGRDEFVKITVDRAFRLTDLSSIPNTIKLDVAQGWINGRGYYRQWTSKAMTLNSPAPAAPRMPNQR